MDVKQIIENQVLTVAMAVEDKLDEEISALDRLDLDDLEALRERRLQQMKKMAEKRSKWLALGHGEYTDISEKDFFAAVKASDRVVCHFYRENWPCKETSMALSLVDHQHLVMSLVNTYFDFRARFRYIHAEQLMLMCQHQPPYQVPCTNQLSLLLHSYLVLLLLMISLSLFTRVMDKHLSILAKQHIETRFIKVHAEKSPFLTEKLRVVVLPTLALVKNAKVEDYVVGFDQLGATDEFSTEDLEERLAKSQVISFDGESSQMKSATTSKRNVRQSENPKDSDSD